MTIPHDTLETVREQSDIVEIVREYVPNLKQAGRNFKACCPFHQEKTPSFNVNQEKQVFYCFGCQEGGDVFKFLMKIENMNFSEAAGKLAERSGVRWEPARESLGPQERERLALGEILDFAKDFYRSLLLKSPEADGARTYLVRRKVSPESAERFELGYSLPDGASFHEAGLRKGFRPDLMARAGLLTLQEGSRQYRDYFRGRLLFPIRGARGEMLGFGARALSDGVQPKYLNSPDTPVFSKGRVLYGLSYAAPAARKERKLIFLEGYMDVLAAHQFEISHSVAPLGTAITSDHARLIRRVAEEVVLVFDPDAAGVRASLRSAEFLLEQGLFVRVARLTEGLDPDEFLHKHGAATFQKCLEQAMDVVEFQMAVSLERFPSALNSQQKTQLAQGLLETISKQSNPILRQEWVRRVSQKLDLDQASLFAQLERLKAPAQRGHPSAVLGTGKAPVGLPSLEERILQLALKHPQVLLSASCVDNADFGQPGCRRVWEIVQEEAGKEAGEPGGTARILGRLPESDAAWVSRLLLEEIEYANPEAHLRRLAADLKRKRLEQEEALIHQEIAALNRSGKEVDLKKIQRHQDLVRELKKSAASSADSYSQSPSPLTGEGGGEGGAVS